MVVNLRNEKIRILIVEDQMPVAMMMTFLLARAGCETEVVTTGAKAIRMAQEGDFDLITLDVDLPDTSGYEICRYFKENPFLSDTPIVFVSGRPCEQDVQRGLELGAADYIEKPFEINDFVFRITSQAKTKNCLSNIFDENTDTNTQRLCNTP